MDQNSTPKSHLNVASILVSLVTMVVGYYLGRGGMGPPSLSEFVFYGAVRIGGLAAALALALVAMGRGEEPFPITITSAILPPLIGSAWILHR